MKKLLLISILFTSSVFPQNFRGGNILEAKLNLLPAKKSAMPRIPPVEEKKSVGLALLYSFLLPGMGELYAGDYSFGKYLTIADGALWATFAGMNYYGSWQKENYTAFAASNGEVNPDEKDSKYFATIGGYMNIDQYNRELELRRDFKNLYDTKTDYWRWKTNSDRKEYRGMWLASESAYNNLRFVVGAMVLNRIVSMIYAARLVSKHNKNLKHELSWNVAFGYDRFPQNFPRLSLKFRKAISF